MIDGVIVALFVVYSLAAGFFYRRKASRGLADYFLAGRSLNGWQAGCSMAATQFSADTPLLVMGLVATGGIFALWRLWVYALAFLVMGFILGSAWRRSGVLTDAELTELRYAGRGAAFLRCVKAIHMGTLINCTVLAMVLLAVTRLSEPFLTWHLWFPGVGITHLAEWLQNQNIRVTALPAGHSEEWLLSANNLVTIGCLALFTFCYSSVGGLRGVVATDVVQFGIAMAATLLYAFIVVEKAGGLGALPGKLEALYGGASRDKLMAFGFNHWNEGVMLFLGVLGVQWFAQANADGTGYLAQRTLACRTDRDAKLAAVVFTFSQVVFRSLLWIPLALGLLVLYPASEEAVRTGGSEVYKLTREATFAQGMKDFLPPGCLGLMLTGMLAALASTIDTHLNWGASYWTHDLYDRFLMKKVFRRKCTGRELVWVARGSGVGILVLSGWIMVHLSSVQSAWHLSLLFGSGLGVVLVLRWLWYRINRWSEISAGAVSVCLAGVLLFVFPDLREAERLLWMTGLSSVVVFAATLWTPAEPMEVLKRFYKKVNPCGFWGPVAQAAGEDPGLCVSRLQKKAAAVVLAFLSVCFYLVGFGQWILQGAGTSFSAGPFLLVFLGTAFVPFWWTLAFRDS